MLNNYTSYKVVITSANSDTHADILLALIIDN